MTPRAIRLVIALIATIAIVSCASSRGPRGGDPERQLAAATAAEDVAKVKQLMAAGADPNKMVEFNGDTLSPWTIALRQIRPKHPQRVEIALAMLDAGASAQSAWGDASPRGPESFWQRMRHARTAGIQNLSPLEVMTFPDAALVRALIAKGITPAQATSQLLGAVEAGEDEIARLLVEAGANVNAGTGSTPLVAAIERRDVPLVTFLEEHGAREKP
jgi:hypothetical protein